MTGGIILRIADNVVSFNRVVTQCFFTGRRPGRSERKNLVRFKPQGN